MTGRGEPTSSEPESNPPEEKIEAVPGYRDLTRIGHGGFSVVYRAIQESFERPVALKVLSVGPDEEARRRFLREVRLAGQLSGHPHVVTVLDYGTTASGHPYLAMDLYDGGSMKERLKRSGPLSAAETAMVGAKIAEALAAAHSVGVLHRDVTPNNILVSKFGEPGLADFGVSCLLDSSASNSVLDIFSPQHAAPELMTRGVPTAASDVYALGSTLYQLLTGQPPFGGEGLDVRSIMWRTMSDPAPRPDCPEIPGLADAIVRAMAKEPEERFPDAAAFARTLRGLIPEGTPSTLPMSGSGKADLPDSGSADSTGSTGSRTGDGSTAVYAEATGSNFYTGGTGSNPLRRTDVTMVRPDRADPEPEASGGAGGGKRTGSSSEGRRRAMVPLILAVTVAVLGTAAWAMFGSQGPNGSPDASSSGSAIAAAPSAAATRTATAKPTLTASPKPSHTATATPSYNLTPTRTAPSVAPSSSAPVAPATSTAPGLLNGTPNRYRSAQSGNCLTSGSGSTSQSSCGAGGTTQGWENSLALGGLLAGQFNLVNENTGFCLTASGGSVSAQSCSGASSQLWSTVNAAGGQELKDSGGNCLEAAGSSGVTVGSCSGSRAVVWTQSAN